MADDGGVGGLFSFEGRINRGTFWKITLGMLVIVVLLGIGAAVAIPMFAGGAAAPPPDAGAEAIGSGGMVAIAFAVVFYGVVLWLSFATQARRWHDLDKSAWHVLLNFIPLVGLIAWLYTGFAPGTEGENRFGAAPH